MRAGRSALLQALPDILDAQSEVLSPLLKGELAELRDALDHLGKRIEHYNQRIKQAAQGDERSRRLMTIGGVGPLVSTALLAAMGTGEGFKNGRQFAAWLGLVPRQCSTGGKERLLGISKRGDVYLRSLLIHGARACMQSVHKKTDARSQWAHQLPGRRPANVTTVALANKLARTAFALLKTGAEDWYSAKA